MKQYIERNGNTLKVEVYYNLGGMNYFTSRVEKRGYYLSVCPVKRTVSECGSYATETYGAFTGVKELIMEVKRKSKKAEEESETIVEGRIDLLIEHVLHKNNLAV
jgi:hypothetical protein